MKKIRLDLKDIVQPEMQKTCMVLKERKFVPNEDKTKLEKIKNYIGELEDETEKRKDELK